MGIESLDDEILKNLKKSQRVHHVQRFSENCAKHGMDILGYFILGAPGETEAYCQKLPEMINELQIRIPYFNVLSPLAETPYYRELLRAGKFERDHWLDFCKDPVKDFIMPDVRPMEERLMLDATIKDYVAYFKKPISKPLRPNKVSGEDPVLDDRCSRRPCLAPIAEAETFSITSDPRDALHIRDSEKQS